MAEAARPGPGPTTMRLPVSLSDLPLWVGLAALAIPTVVSLGQESWSREAGAHGPIVVAVGGWLLVKEFAGAKPLARAGAAWLTFTALILSLLVYVFGRSFDFITLEVAGLYVAGIAILYSRIGMRALIHLWFPVTYLAFLVPPPNWFMDRATAPLKQFVSWAAMSVLSGFGVPVAREGVTIYVSDYQLLVEDACSGMNSIVGLVAVSLLYIYLLRGSTVRYALLLVASVIPIAILGNIVRIMTLILLTYFFGDAVAQGFLHETAGLFLFVVDLVLVFLWDKALWRVVPKSWRNT